MNRLIVLSLALAAQAFKDTSPFFYLSTSKLSTPFPSDSLTPASTISNALLDVAGTCQSTTYIIAHQPTVSIEDFEAPGAAPHLRRFVVNGTDGLHEHHVVPEVWGAVDIRAIANVLLHKCGAAIVIVNPSTGEIPTLSTGTDVLEITFDAIPSNDKASSRHHKLSDHDNFLHAVISNMPTGHAYTLIYYTSPTNALDYRTQAQDPFVHSEFKRAESHATNTTGAPLFEKYSFLSPALLMGFFTLIPLFALFYVGLSALTSLKVSYFAFSKEMGQLAQKKQ